MVYPFTNKAGHPSSPCTTFCDWRLQNGGTRTFQNPAGLPTAKEHIGNALSEYGAALFETSLVQGGFPIAESSGTSGRPAMAAVATKARRGLH